MAGTISRLTPAYLKVLPFGTRTAQFIAHDRKGEIAEVVAMEEMAVELGIATAHRPLDLQHVADLEAGGADDQFLS